MRAFAKFQREFPASKLTIAGEGSQLGELQTLARELQIASSVDFAGFVSQEKLRELFYSSHIFLHPSETGPDRNHQWGRRSRTMSSLSLSSFRGNGT